MIIDAPPRSVDLDGTPVAVRRSWPATPESLIIEVGVEGGHVRGGTWKRRPLSVAPVAQVMPAGVDRRLPALARWRDRGTIVVHRLGKRAVVRHRDGLAYTKIIRPGRAAAVVAAAERAAAFGAAFAIAETHHHDEETVTFSSLPGPTLHDLARCGTDQVWSRAWADWARGWLTAVAPHRLGGQGSIPVHDAHREAGVLRTWVGHVASRVGTADAVELTAAVELVTAQLVADGQDRWVLSHRDLHDKQLVIGPDAIGLLDVDTIARAEAALDLANLLAHVDLRRRQCVYTTSQADTARSMINIVAAELGVSPHRLAAYELASTLRLGCVYAFRPPWTAIAADLRARVVREVGSAASQSSSVAPQPK